MRKKFSHILGLSVAILVGLTGCNDPKTYTPAQTDKFTVYREDYYTQADALLQADYLLVLDSSFSMRYAGKLAEISNSFGAFIGEIENQNIDYRVSVVEGTVQSTGNINAQINQKTLSPVLSLEDDIVSSLSNFIGYMGQANNPNQAHLMEIARRKLTQSNNFLRTNAQLVMLFVTDNQDHSSLSTNQYVSAFKALKPNPAYISARAVMAGKPSLNAFGQNTNCSLRPELHQKSADKLYQVVQQVDAVGVGSVYCVNEPMGNILTNLARNVNKPTNRFLIQGNPDPSSISISVKEPNQGWSPKALGVDYSYNASTNEVIFVDGREPSNSAQLKISYDPIFQLSRTPIESSIEVTVNGQSVPKSNTNGWSYIATENRVTFHGSYKPAQNDIVKISYKSLN